MMAAKNQNGPLRMSTEVKLLSVDPKIRARTVVPKKSGAIPKN